MRVLTFPRNSIPYAPFSKNDRLGRIVDWNQGDPAQIAAGASNRRQGAQGGKYAREPKEAYGAASAGTFAYFHDEDEASFSLVDGKAAAAKRGAGQGGGLQLRSNQMNKQGQRQPGRPGQQTGRGGAQYGRQGGRQDLRATGKGGRPGQQGRFGWRDWKQEQRTRDASVVVGPDWQVLEEVEFSRLSKLRLEVDTMDPETM